MKNQKEMILSPSILAADFADLLNCVIKTEKAGAKWLHIDVMDGMFVPNLSFGACVYRSIRKYSDQFFDVHLMIVDPERYINDFIDAGADGITFHIEATKDPDKCIEMIHKKGKRAGIALNPETDPKMVIPYIGKADMILVMSVHPGYGGQKYIPEVDEKISYIRSVAGESFDIEVDGGINLDNIKKVYDLGANIIVAGSAVFKGDISGSTRKLIEECKK